MKISHANRGERGSYCVSNILMKILKDSNTEFVAEVKRLLDDYLAQWTRAGA